MRKAIVPMAISVALLMSPMAHVSAESAIEKKSLAKPAASASNSHSGVSSQNGALSEQMFIPFWDTLYVTTSGSGNRKGLSIAINGGFGNLGDGKVNLDFSEWGDCDTSATVYLYDGTVAVGFVSGADTNMYWIMFDSDALSETGLRPVNGPVLPSQKSCTARNFNLLYTGRFCTQDSSITMEKTWYAPILAGSGTADSAWMIQGLKLWNSSGSTLSNVVVGEIADWDIPSDSGARNSAANYPVKNLICQQGAELNDIGECQDNNTRFGAVRYLGGFKNATAISAPSGAYAREMSIDVYPSGDFLEKDLFTNMQGSGFNATNSIADLYTAMTFVRNQTLATTDTLRFYTAWLTVQNGDTTALFTMADRALGWYTAKGISSLRDTVCGSVTCCVLEGDFNHDGRLNILDVMAYVNFLMQGGPIYVCRSEADYNDSGSVSMLALMSVVRRLFQGGPFNPCP